MDSSSTLDVTPTPPKTAGRKKIKIQRIEDSRNRQVTFLKRKNGLLKKAMELGILCDCEVSVIIFNLNNGKLFEYSSVEPQTVLQKYATYSGPSERRRKERFFELAASKGTSNIPVNEPNLAQAAMEAASAAVRRPRPTHKFSTSHNSPEQGQYYNGRKLSSGESPGNLPVPEQGPTQAHLKPSNNPSLYPMPAPPAIAPSTAESAMHVENSRHQSGTALHMGYTPRYLTEDHDPPAFTPRSAGRQLSAAFGLPTPRTNIGPPTEDYMQPHIRHHLGLEQPHSQLPAVHSGNDHLRQTPSAGNPGQKPLPSQRSTVPSESTRLDATAPSNKEWSRSPNAPQVSVRGNVTDKEVAAPKPQHLTPTEHRHVQNVRNPGQRARPNLTVQIPNSNRESQQCGPLSAPNSLSSPSTGEDLFRGANSSRIPSMSPFGNTTWPPWNPNSSMSNDRDMPSVPLTPFLNMGAFGGNGESAGFGFGNGSNFALPSPTNAGLIPLTPRFLGIELPDTARPDNQSGGPQKRTFDFSFGARPEPSPSRRRI